MRIAVLGAGVIGVTTAWYLCRQGHEVTVVDRQPGPGLETSFANAGEISPGYASPWAAPGVPLKAIKWMLMEHPPLILEPWRDLAMLPWLYQTFRNCNAGRYAVNKARMVRLAEFSRDQLVALREALHLRYDERSLGTLQLFRTQEQLDGVAKDVRILRDFGVSHEVLSREDCLRVEPGLAGAAASIAGGLRLPGDETGDCYLFTHALAKLAEAFGVRFRYNTTLNGLRRDGERVAAALTDKGEISADAFVLATGSYTPALAHDLGLRVPVYPVKGYSITAPVIAAGRAPVSTVLDESFKVAITRLGDRIRVGGMAELSGFNDRLTPKRRQTLELSLHSLFPGAAGRDNVKFWTGLRPMTPDSTPIVGPTGLANVYLNTGHGTLGWTMACGSAHVLADIISGRPPAIRADDLALSRYP